MDTYAIDYTISQSAGTLSKADFRELQVVTEKVLKNHMINEYKLSTQADLCDFTASFVTAHYTYVYLTGKCEFWRILILSIRIDFAVLTSFYFVSFY